MERNNFSQLKSRWIASPVWIGFFFVLILGALAHLVSPFFFPELFENGVLVFLKEPLSFHYIGEAVALRPWSEFTIFPEGQFPAGVMALVYKLSGIHKPFTILPVLGILAGLTIRGIASCLDVLGVRGRWWPVLIGVLLTLTPTSLSWMIYPHKDSFIVPGVILITWSFMSVIFRPISLRHFGALVLGSLLVFSNRPYFSEMFFLGTLLALPIAWKRGLRFFLVGLVLFFLVFQTLEVSKPRSLDLAGKRESFLNQKAYGKTNFMPEVRLEGALDTVLFIPRAVQLAIFEPLPWKTPFEGSRLAKRILFFAVQLEMLLLYISIFFLLASGKKSWNRAVFIPLAIAAPFLIIFGFTVPNIGTINRYRFPFLILIKIAGFAALWNSPRFKWPGRLLMWVDPPAIPRQKKKILFLVPDDATFIIQRLVMAQGAQKAGYDVHVAAEDTGVSEKINSLGFTFHRLDLNRGGLNPFADFVPFIKLMFFLAKERPDILQCVSIKPVLYGATAGTIVGLKRIVCLVNGLGYAFEGTNLKGKIVKKVAMALYRNALALPGIRVIFQNPDDRDYFVANRLVDSDKTILIRGSGVNMAKFIPSAQPNDTRPVILFVGRLLWNKGIKELVEASRTLKLEKLDFSLKIVGAPDARNPEAVPEVYLKTLHDEGIIDWVGRQSDMPKFYRESDIVCLPTQYKEGLPLTLLEAASTGRALVATDVPGCREIVRSSINGFLVPPKSSTELADALRSLITDPDLRRKYGDASTRIVKEEFSAEIIQAQLVAVYESLLNDSSPSSNNLTQCTVTSLA